MGGADAGGPAELRVEHPRCPFCHEAVRPEERKRGCERCQGWQHTACWDEARGRCAACGALSQASVTADAHRAQLQRSARRTVWLSLAACVPLFALVGTLIGGALEHSYQGGVAGAALGLLVGLLLPVKLAMRDVRRATRRLEAEIRRDPHAAGGAEPESDRERAPPKKGKERA